MRLRPIDDLDPRIAEILEAAERIAQGDLEARLSPDSAAGDLGLAFEKMRHRVVELTEQVSNLCRRLEEEERKQTLDHQMRERELNALRAVVDVAVSAFGPKEFLQRHSREIVQQSLQRAVDVVGADTGEVLLFDEERDALSHVAWVGPPRIGGREIPPLGSALLAYQQADCWPMRLYAVWGERIIGLPILMDERPVGLLLLSRLGSKADFDQHEISLLEVFAELVSLVAERGYRAGTLWKDQPSGQQDWIGAALVGMFSHELRTPLGLIKAAASMLRVANARPSSKLVREYVAIIEREADKLNGIIEGYLDPSRSGAVGRWHLDVAPLDIVQLARRAVDRVSWNTGRAYSFSIDFPADFPLLHADEERIEQVLTNLLENAVKYSPDGGVISIGGLVHSPDGSPAVARITVQDQGIGIAEHELEKVFQRFYRVHNEVVERTGGHGLGLAICRDIVEAHGGRIWAESQPGKGSSFIFTLPCCTILPGKQTGKAADCGK